ncbi:cytochrome b [Celerinatantimonas diazotrophica]|uniref:Cytochrome b561 n=1 Tax=Celerinatantimonas diazotrophica TaxID=412034 RepID=A0A4R1J9W4_9GAMM|nr:cytochrome b [Celerinatantimonas diazotrophica]TCK47402.1 cytochrome b561 [Celerinatantimonas diazotrophica]CAG9294980.1 Cytochrome b561 [Celerinatantimonas diazotrophica]
MQRFSSWTIGLHWLSVGLVIGAYTSVNLKDAFSDYRISELLRLVHFNCGGLLWGVMMARFVIFITRSKAVAIVPPIARLQQVISKLMHYLMFACFLSLPILGALSLALQQQSWPFLGIMTPILGEDFKASVQLHQFHEQIATIGYFLVGLHALAAFYHHFVRKDNTLLRMLPGRREHHHTKP